MPYLRTIGPALGLIDAPGLMQRQTLYQDFLPLQVVTEIPPAVHLGLPAKRVIRRLIYKAQKVITEISPVFLFLGFWACPPGPFPRTGQKVIRRLNYKAQKVTTEIHPVFQRFCPPDPSPRTGQKVIRILNHKAQKVITEIPSVFLGFWA